MTIKTIVAIVLALMVAASGMAQTSDQQPSPAATAPETGESGTSSAAMPAVTEPGPDGEQGMLSGDKPFTLMVDPEVGELNYIFDESKNLESIQAKRGVVFSSEDMTLNSDEFDYKTLNSQLVATGKRVVVRLGEVIVTCQLFKYNPDREDGDFTGNPVVYSRDATGKTRVTAGGRITIHNVNGKTQMNVQGRGTTPYMRSNAPEPPVPSETTRPTPGKGARMSLDNNTAPGGSNVSPVATPGTSGAPARSGGLLGLPVGSGNDNSVPAAKPRGNRIDPNNPEDVRSVIKKQQ
ncbi:MAG: hypothetical protein ACR2IE_01080 [Candidatus Sumerlaeaceae bacterium]